MLLLDQLHQNCQAVFGCFEHEWLKLGIGHIILGQPRVESGLGGQEAQGPQRTQVGLDVDLFIILSCSVICYPTNMNMFPFPLPDHETILKKNVHNNSDFTIK